MKRPDWILIHTSEFESRYVRVDQIVGFTVLGRLEDGTATVFVQLPHGEPIDAGNYPDVDAAFKECSAMLELLQGEMDGLACMSIADAPPSTLTPLATAQQEAHRLRSAVESALPDDRADSAAKLRALLPGDWIEFQVGASVVEALVMGRDGAGPMTVYLLRLENGDTLRLLASDLERFQMVVRGDDSA